MAEKKVGFVESSSLMSLCEALHLPETVAFSGMHYQGVFIVPDGAISEMESYGMPRAYYLADYLLATAPIDLKDE